MESHLVESGTLRQRWLCGMETLVPGWEGPNLDTEFRLWGDA